ncbi:unnamed protein product [Bemisia tabaci]|uniref:Uncharacterized protein n=1 Tax=Bemisia tabaci TaxID=7038 RepID=A0A9P0F6U6_BEMTA|nr:unnamed protein product [Bemisia tabaci]
MTSFGNLIAVGLFIIGPALCNPSLIEKCKYDCKQSYGFVEHGHSNVPIKIGVMQYRPRKCNCKFNLSELKHIIDEANLEAVETDYWEMTQWLKDHGYKLRLNLETCDQVCVQEGGYVQKKKPRKSEHKKIGILRISSANGKEKSTGKKGRKVSFQHGNGEAGSRLHKSGHEETGKDGNQQEESHRVLLKTGHLKNIDNEIGECECRYRKDFYHFLEHEGCDVAAFKKHEDNSTEARNWLIAEGFSVSVIQAHRDVYELEEMPDLECEHNCRVTQGYVGFKKSLFKNDPHGRIPIATDVDENDPSDTQILVIEIPRDEQDPLECKCKINPEVYSHLEKLKINTSHFKTAFFEGEAKGCNWLWWWNLRKGGKYVNVMCPKPPEKPKKSKPPATITTTDEG